MGPLIHPNNSVCRFCLTMGVIYEKTTFSVFSVDRCPFSWWSYWNTPFYFCYHLILRVSSSFTLSLLPNCYGVCSEGRRRKWAFPTIVTFNECKVRLEVKLVHLHSFLIGVNSYVCICRTMLSDLFWGNILLILHPWLFANTCFFFAFECRMLDHLKKQIGWNWLASHLIGWTWLRTVWSIIQWTCSLYFFWQAPMVEANQVCFDQFVLPLCLGYVDYWSQPSQH